MRRREETKATKRRKCKVKYMRLSRDRQLANDKERRRAQKIRDGFNSLAGYVTQGPHEERHLSRVEVLTRAVNYIRYLQNLLRIRHDGLQNSAPAASPVSPNTDHVPDHETLQQSTRSGFTLSAQCSVRRAMLAELDLTRVIPSSTVNGGRVPTRSELALQQSSCDPDVSRIDFDIDEDLSDIPAVSESDIFQLPASCTCNAKRSHSSNNRLQAIPPSNATPNQPSTDRFICNFQETDRVESISWKLRHRPSTATCTLTLTPPHNAYPLLAPPCHAVGIVSNTPSSTVSEHAPAPIPTRYLSRSFSLPGDGTRDR